MESLIENFFNIKIMTDAFPFLVRGLKTTLLLCIIVIPLGLVGGLIVALLTNVKIKIIYYTLIFIIDFFRAVPPLVLLIFIYSGLPFAGIELSPLLAVCFSFFLNNSAYYAEIFRAGIESIGTGQMHAARSTGLNYIQSMIYIILPQSIRNVLPDLLSNSLEVAKLTSIASVVALQELLYSADMARSITYNSSPIILAAGMYLFLLWPFVRILSRLEHSIAK
jgi:polar amino acid transport system permease protein